MDHVGVPVMLMTPQTAKPSQFDAPELFSFHGLCLSELCFADLQLETTMNRFLFLTLNIVLLLLPLVSAGEHQLSSKACEDLGFTGLALCSDCNTFAEYVKNQELVSDCRKCCTEDSDDSMSKVTYSNAILEVCMRKLVFYPEIVAFIEEGKVQFPSVKVEYVYASPPKLVMLDDAGNHKETIRIDNWKREHIRQFLKEKVKQGVSAS